MLFMLGLTALSFASSLGTGLILQATAPEPPKPKKQYRRYGFGAGRSSAAQGAAAYTNQRSLIAPDSAATPSSAGVLVNTNFGVKNRVLLDPRRGYIVEPRGVPEQRRTPLVVSHPRNLMNAERVKPPTPGYGGPVTYLMAKQNDLARAWNRAGRDPRGFWEDNPRLMRGFTIPTEYKHERITPLRPHTTNKWLHFYVSW